MRLLNSSIAKEDVARFTKGWDTMREKHFFAEVWNPFRLVGVRLYRDRNRSWWVKVGRLKMRRIGHW